MSGIINRGSNSATTEDWLNASKDIVLTLYCPSLRASQLELAEQPKDSMHDSEGLSQPETVNNLAARDE